jgi:hypothetical protein
MRPVTAGLFISTLRPWVCALSLGSLAVAPSPHRLSSQSPGVSSPSVSRLTLRWSLDGAWTGVAADERAPTGYALARGGRCVEIDASGKIVREVAFKQESGSLLRLAHVSGTARLVWLAFSVWSTELHAYGPDGTRLWVYPHAGINDVWTADVNGDHVDDVIVGFNGRDGLHVLDSQGQLLWKTTAIGNVWHVAAGDVWGSAGPQPVVTTSAAGLVHVFRNGGQSRVDLPVLRMPPAPVVPETYATMVRVGKATKTDRAATIFAVGERPMKGSGPRTEHVAALSLVGDKEWTLELPARTLHVDSAALASGQPWLAVGLRDGRVHVIDVAQGRIIGTVDDQGSVPEVSWARGRTTPLLLVATGTKLNAFSVATGAPAER